MKRLFSISIIIFLLGVTSFPIVFWSNSDFVYAESEQEELTTDQVIYAGISAYLNSRKAWIVNTVESDVNTVEGIMQQWVDSAQFWSNTTVGGISVLAANIIVKYSPFRIQLKGPAVRAFNDLVQWLIDTGKLSNLENDTAGGQTTDNLFNGYSVGGGLVYYADYTHAYRVTNGQYYWIPYNDVKKGSPVNGFTPQYIRSIFLSKNPDLDFSTQEHQDITNVNISIIYSSNITVNKTLTWYYDSSNDKECYPCISLSPAFPLISTRVNNIYGNTAWYQTNLDGANKFFYGATSYNETLNAFTFTNFGVYTRSNLGNQLKNANINFETDNFEKNDPDPPENDNSITYTPKVKETSGNYTAGDTFNTYNEYITNYVTKNTIINTNESGGGGNEEPEEPGGTTPPWTDNVSSGTLTPNGNGGYDLSLPDLTLPDLDIDWSINGLKDKFPFSIPWDLMAFFTVLNAEPETPHFEGTIPIGIWEWEIDWDLHYFDNLAILVRNLEFIAFCIGLIIVTRNIIKG